MKLENGDAGMVMQLGLVNDPELGRKTPAFKPLPQGAMSGLREAGSSFERLHQPRRILPLIRQLRRGSSAIIYAVKPFPCRAADDPHRVFQPRPRLANHWVAVVSKEQQHQYQSKPLCILRARLAKYALTFYPNMGVTRQIRLTQAVAAADLSHNMP